MKKVTSVSVVIAVLFAICAVPAIAVPVLSTNTHVLYDFETSWSGDYASGWADTNAENGQDPRSVMMEFGYFGYQGGNSMRVIAVDTPSTGAFTADVSPVGYEEAAMAKEYDPWIKVMYYDEGFDSEASYNSTLHRAGQMFAVPDSSAITGSTDVQFGAGASSGDYYAYANAESSGSASIALTGVARADGWQELAMQLSSVDGKIHFYIEGAEVGATSRNDYLNLVGFGLSTVFTSALQDWPHNNPSTVWDNYEFGSSYVPEPMTLSLLGLGSLVVLKRKRS